MHPSQWAPQTKTSVGRSRSRMDLGGLFLIVNYEQEVDGEVSFRGHGVYGWDPRRESYTMHWFDSMGYPPGGMALGTWEGDTLTFESKSEHGHSRYVYVHPEPGRYEFRIESSPDGETWSTVMESTMRREADQGLA